MSYYLKVLKNYVNFKGRARRKEYWMFVLFNMIAAIIAMILDNVFHTGFTMDVQGMEVPLGYGWIYCIYALAIILPSLAVFVRRMHDIGKSGWWFFITLIPLVGAIWMLVLLCKAGDVGDNNYGSDPKLESTAE